VCSRRRTPKKVVGRQRQARRPLEVSRSLRRIVMPLRDYVSESRAAPTVPDSGNGSTVTPMFTATAELADQDEYVGA